MERPSHHSQWHVLASAYWSPWRDLPERYGPWRTIYDRFNRYRKDGTLDRLIEALQCHLDDQGLIAWDLWCIDGSIIQASPAAAGAGQKGDLMSFQIMPSDAAKAALQVKSTW